VARAYLLVRASSPHGPGKYRNRLPAMEKKQPERELPEVVSGITPPYHPVTSRSIPPSTAGGSRTCARGIKEKDFGCWSRQLSRFSVAER
jgi:hypothetical protein